MYNEITWKYGEKITWEYMKNLGYKIIYTNIFCVNVELDIVSILQVKMQKKLLKKELKLKLKDKKNCKISPKTLKKAYKNAKKQLNNLLIITEVKSRSTNDFGEGLCAIDEMKIRHIKRGAKYLLQKKEFTNMQVRFDVSSVDDGKITYIENAF